MGAVLSGIKIASSPRWMQNRLIASGMEPINNVIDITNYVMLEIGNPLHAFDFDRIKNGGSPKASRRVTIVVRRAKQNEALELLNETKLKLDKDDLVIANEKKALALAGIKGGKDSGINSETTCIILEAANFNSLSVRKTRQRYGLTTEAQARFEKGISPILAQKALVRAVALLEKYAGGVLEEVVDVNDHKDKKEKVLLNFQQVNKLLGIPVEPLLVENTLRNLGFEKVGEKKQGIEFRIPYWRLDIEGAEDLIEEVGRINGYEKIPEKAIRADIEIPPKNEERIFNWKLRESMIGLGFDEVLNYSFYGAKTVERFGIDGKHYELENPLNDDQLFLRKTLLPNLISNLEKNQKNFNEIEIFELGRNYFPAKNLPQERMALAGLIFNKEARKDLFYDLKGRLEELFAALGLKKDEAVFSSLKKKAGNIYQLGKTAGITLDNQPIGTVGEISRQIKKELKIEGKVVLFELRSEELFRANQKAVRDKIYHPVSKFPKVLRDISLFVENKTEAGQIIEIIKKAGGENLLSAELFDVYWDGKSLEKSLAFHLEFGSDKRTLTSEEVDHKMEMIVKILESKGARARK
ncbi:MAG: phenylalanine--tRNA ligase subunit beta [Candidatus Moranbacteria bacterium]|nr:phenylalanine--tRNA ligase subunit beta [Candidatus Moranbacteria bacterium]